MTKLLKLLDEEKAVLTAISEQDLNNLEIDEILSKSEFYPEDLDATLADMVKRKILIRRVKWIAYYSISSEYFL